MYLRNTIKTNMLKCSRHQRTRYLTFLPKKKNVLGEGIVSGSGTVPAIVLKLRTKHYLRKRFHNVFILKL